MTRTSEKESKKIREGEGETREANVNPTANSSG